MKTEVYILKRSGYITYDYNSRGKISTAVPPGLTPSVHKFHRLDPKHIVETWTRGLDVQYYPLPSYIQY